MVGELLPSTINVILYSSVITGTYDSPCMIHFHINELGPYLNLSVLLFESYIFETKESKQVESKSKDSKDNEETNAQKKAIARLQVYVSDLWPVLKHKSITYLLALFLL